MLAILLLALNQWNSTIKSKNISLTHVCRERHQSVSFTSLYANLYLLHCGAYNEISSTKEYAVPLGMQLENDDLFSPAICSLRVHIVLAVRTTN